MSDTIPGTFYTVVAGDTIRAIARRAYGWDRSPEIVSGNHELLKDRGISLEGLPIIFRGDSLWLPDIAARFSQRIPSQVDDEISIRIDGQVFKGWTATSITRNINTISDAFTF